MPTRCNCPPESWSQRANSLSASCTRARASRAPAVSCGYSSEASAFHAGHRPSRPASTAVTTRWRGGMGGAWCTVPMRARSSRGAPALDAGTSLPSTLRRPWLGASAVPMTDSSVVLPAPEGPISAMASPWRAASVTPRSAMPPPAWVRPTPSSSKLMDCACCGLLEQAGRLGGSLDAFVVRGLGGHEARGALQLQDGLVLGLGRVQRQEGVGQLLDQGRVQVAAHGPVVVEVGRRGGEHAHLAGIDLLGLHQLVPDRGVEHAGLGLACG